eukprot:Rhum_TRINITY_DN1917_c0_g1::Rhum_TRINITY_DN1917_c0_g1_i1::g.5208::m.5208
MQSIWLSPMGTGDQFDWASLEALLDGDADQSPSATEHSEAGYWGVARGAHFWGTTECPVRRPIAAVLPCPAGADDWASSAETSAALAQKATNYKRELISAKFGRAVPGGRPLPLDTHRVLGTVKAARKESRVVVGWVAVKNLYIAPLSASQTNKVMDAAEEDLTSALGHRVSVSSVSAGPKNTSLTFHVVASDTAAGDVLEKCRKMVTTALPPLTHTSRLFKSFAISPCRAELRVDGTNSGVVCKQRLCQRGNVATTGSADYVGAKAGRAEPTHTPRRSSFKKDGPPVAYGSGGGSGGGGGVGGGGGAAARVSGGGAGGVRTTEGGLASTARTMGAGSPAAGGGYSSPGQTGTPSRTGGLSSTQRPSTGRTGGSASPSLSASSPSIGSPMTAAERKRALLGGVLKRTKQAINKVEEDVPQVASTYAQQQTRKAITQANQELAHDRGVGLQAAVAMAKAALKPPCYWLGAMVRTEASGGGRKQIENFELNVVDFNVETRVMVGRARVQNGKMDMTYQCKVRVLNKDHKLVVEMSMDNGGICFGTFEKQGQLAGNFKFPNGTGTFKLMREEAESSENF